MRKRALWAGALPAIALAAAVIGPLTASTREVQEELNGTIWVANRGTAPATADTIRAFDTRTGDVTHIMLTHNQLDHAGVTGTLFRRHPNLRVLVH